MPDIQALTITPVSTAAVVAGSVVVLPAGIVAALSAAQKTALLPFIVPDVQVSCLVTDSRTGATLRDFSAAVSLWDAFRQLGQAQRDDIVSELVIKLIHHRAGL